MLGCGDVEILDASSIPTPIYNLGSRVRLYSTKPDDPQDGDLWIDGDGSWIIVADGAEVQLAMSEADVGVLVQTIAYPRAEIDTMLEGYAKAAAVDELRSDLDKTTSDLSTTDDKVAKLDGIVDSI